MNRLKTLMLLSLIFFTFGCKNDGSTGNKLEADSIKYYSAKVVALDNIDCHLPEIVFIGDTMGISEILDDTNYTYNKMAFKRDPYNYHFLVKDLPDNLKFNDLQIWIKFRIPLQSEYEICTSLGPTYPLLIIISASKLE